MDRLTDQDGYKNDNCRRVDLFRRKNPTFTSYEMAQQRCQNPKHRSYKNYGGRGIKMIFKSYREIIEDIGPRPIGKTLDRINNKGHYEKGNIRWATLEEQARNKSNNTLTPFKVSVARSLKSLGYKLGIISIMLGVHRVTVSDSLRGLTWKD